MTIQKKSLRIIACFVAFAVVVGVFSFCAVSVNDTAEAYDVELFGYELTDGYDVSITYNYYVKYITGLYFSYEVTFDNTFYEKVADKKKLMFSVKDTFVKNAFEIECDITNGKLTAFKSYETTEEYYAEQGIDGYYVGTVTEPSKKTLFYTEYVSTQKTVMADLFRTDDRYVGRIYKVCSEAGIADERMKLRCVYGTPYGENTLKTTADEVDYSNSDKLYYHIFDMTVETKDREITIKQRVPNSDGWYLVAVIAGLVVLIAPLTVAIIKKKRRG